MAEKWKAGSLRRRGVGPAGGKDVCVCYHMLASLIGTSLPLACLQDIL